MTIEIFLIALALGVITGFIVAGVLKGQLKSVRFQSGAGSYELPGSLRLTCSTDRYLFSNVTRTPKPQSSNRRKP